jgi:hypothetical protein
MAITHSIAKKLINYESEKSAAFKLRKKRAERIKSLIKECHKKYREVNIIDIGGTKTYWKIIPTDFLTEHKVHISIVNLPSNKPIPEKDNIFSFHVGDGCNLIKFADNSFHIAHSNSVIEHVGDESKRIMFANEIKRVAETYYLQTPNYWFPIEPHFVTPFFHWLPLQIRTKMLLHFDLGWFKKAKTYDEARRAVESCYLLTKKELKALFPEATLYKEKVAFFNKSLIVIKKTIPINNA